MVHADYGQLLLDGMRPEQQIRATARASPDGSNLVILYKASAKLGVSLVD